ncbi:hypothetical protein M758_6G034400 [Ceratodon purpureus]|nr:hypothetical protein M758_6G034400 [Ceratodon purpureus]
MHTHFGLSTFDYIKRARRHCFCMLPLLQPSAACFVSLAAKQASQMGTMAKLIKMRSLALGLFIALLATAAMAAAQDGDFDQWLQYIAETSDNDDDATLSSPASPDADAVTGTWKGGVSELSSSQDKDGSLTKMPKVNRDSIGVLPKPTGKPVKVVVSKDGKGDYTTITDAINAIPLHAKYRTIIHIKAGVYKEKLVINETKHYITFLGDGMHKSIISWNDTAGDFDDADVLLKTYRSATVGISSEWFIAKGVSFVNTAPSPPAGAVLRQAVALRITGDRAAFYNCSFYGYQDTLYDHRGRHYFENCFIQGSIDFIFGNGRSLYRSCELHVVADSFGSLTAQKRNETKMHTGFSFVDCHVDGTGIIYLGRAWGNYSRTVFSYTYFSDIIYGPGWSDFGFPNRQAQSLFGQYKCDGPGANSPEQVKWARHLTPQEVKPFLSVGFINGKKWLPHYIKKPKFT